MIIGDTTIHEVSEISISEPTLIRRGQPDWFESQTIAVETAAGARFSFVLIGQNAKPLPRIENFQDARDDLRVALADLLNVIEVDSLLPESLSYMKQARAALAKAEG